MPERTSKLFQPARLGDLELANRVMMAPMTRSRAGAGMPTDMMGTYYEQRATAGLIISEGAAISREAFGYLNVPGIYTTSQVETWRAVTDKVHAAGGRIFAQIWHVGRISHPDLLGGALPLAPSAINPHFKTVTANGLQDTVTPRAMSVEDIERTIGDYARAASNAIAAGFDGVQIHAANGYLIHQFLAPSANHRTDAFGGSRENRSRFLFAVVEAVSAAIGSRRTAVRLNPVMDGRGGIELDDALKETFDHVIPRLGECDLAFLELTSMAFDPALNVAAQTVAMGRRYRPVYSGQLVINGELTRDAALSAVGEGVADFVSFGKAYVANPDLVRRLAEGIALAPLQPDGLYRGGAAGYVDYPFAEQQPVGGE